MLRLASTRITLDSSDVRWHVHRHEKRLARLEEEKPATDVPGESSSQPQSPRPRHEHPLRTRQRSPDEIPIYSDEPVPRDSQAFWDRIVADAGTPARLHQQSLARSPQLIVPSNSFLENNGSVRLSVRGENEDDEAQSHDLDSLQELSISPRSPVSDASETLTEVESHLPARSLPSLDREEDRPQPLQSHQSSSEHSDSSAKTEVGSDATLDSHPFRSPKNRGLNSQAPWFGQMDVDGPSDAAPSRQHHRSTSSLQDPEPGSFGMPFGAQARKAELAASRNASVAHSRISIPSASSQAQYTGDHSVQHSRTRSGGFQRSRLYISEAAASSSPDKRPRSPAASRDEPDELNLLSLPPRRRNKYKQRSETYSYVASEASEAATARIESPQFALATDNPFEVSRDRNLQAEPSNAGGNVRAYDDYTLSSPPGPIHYHSNSSFSSPRNTQRYQTTSSRYSGSNLSHSRHSSSTYPHDTSPYSRNASSMELPYIANASTHTSPNPLRRPFDPLPRLFSGGPRTPSATAAFAPNMPAADENGRQPSSPYIPSTPTRSLSATSVQQTPTRLSIYNDSLPAHVQPQTPVGLPRNGLPLQNPFFTAPARAGSRITSRAAGWLHSAFATPSRVERGADIVNWERSNEQENVGVEVEAARLERRMERMERMEDERRMRRSGSGRGWRMSDWEG
ncbi:MAG: hypothetical protein LQ346_002338 [Caloplaca aetnensis]|nr:MAG: hypothetical protein LQ346_002338 [Caloplaca aetnensis]